jgi:SAM-dependent methyltransferase
MKNICDLIEFDVDFYRRHHVDLLAFTDHSARNHYSQHGYWEGRRSHIHDVRESFVGLLSDREVLEIGPFFNPLISGENVRYLDVRDRDGLIQRAVQEGGKPEAVPHIDYVSKDGSMDMVDRSFDAVASSHNIEHQPDLIAHFNGVSRVLKPGGFYAVIVPNARFCFDARLPLTKISEIFNARIEGRRRHTFGSVIEHRALSTHNDPVRHWDDFSASCRTYHKIDVSRVKAAIAEYHGAGDRYIDVHAWQFDPASFSDICNCLIALGEISFSRISCHGPVRGRHEFTAVLHI